MAVIYKVTVESDGKEDLYWITWHKMGAGTSDSFSGALEIALQENQSLWYHTKYQLDIGMKLFHFLDGDGHHFQRALQEAEQQGEALQLHLYACKEISDWPFELLAADGTFLLLRRVHLVNHVSDWGIEKKIPTQNRPLKILFAASSPLDLELGLDYEREEEAIFKITENQAVDLEVEDSGSLSGLCLALEQNQYDVVHLSGHSDIDINGVPYFIMEDETGHTQKIYPPILWQDALIENPPRLLLLSGNSAGQKPKNLDISELNSFGLKMVESYGVPAVLVLGGSIKEKQTAYAAQILYHELSRGRSILEAVQQARYELMLHLPSDEQSAWPLLRLFSSGVELNAVVAKGQQMKPGLRRMKHIYLKHSPTTKMLVEGFIGRRRQIQRILRSLKQDFDKVGVLILGTSGLGKSCLAGKVCEWFPDHTLIIVHGRLNAISIESALKDAFGTAQDKKGRRILAQKMEMSQKLADLCITSFKEKNYLFLLDDFDMNLEGAEKGRPGSLLPEAAELLKKLLHFLPFSGKMTQIIVTSRYLFSITEQSRDQVKERLESVWLTGFNESEQHNKARGLKNIYSYPDRSLIPKLAAAGHGNPRLMEWLDVLVGQMNTADTSELLEAIKGKKEEFIRSHVLKELVQRGGKKLEEFLRYLSIYRRAVSIIGVQQVAKKTDLKNWKELLEIAVELSLVEFDQALRRYQVIPLLQDELLRNLEDSRSLHMAAFNYYKKECENRETLEPILWEELIFHALNCGEENIAFQQGGRLVKYLRQQLAFQESLRVGESILTGLKCKFPTVDYAFFSNELASTYYDLGDYLKAIEYYKQAMVTWKEIYGEKHPDVADSLKNIGSSWEAIGDYRQAIEYYEKALAALEEIHGKRHLYVADVLNKLGVSWNALGENRKAIEYFEQALAIWKKIHGNKHTQVAAGLNNLGLTMNALGDSKKAIEHYEQALIIDKSVYGEKHPDIAIDLNNLGSAWSTLGDSRKAIEFYERALVIDEVFFGQEHPNVAREFNNLGSAWYDLRDFGKALDYFQKALIINEAVFGRKHPDVARSLNNLGSVYNALNDHSKALEYYQEALDIVKDVYGEKHRYVAETMHNIGLVLVSLGDLRKAITNFKQALAIDEVVFGREHSNTARDLNSLGESWQELGEPRKAIIYFQKALDILKKFYGEKHHLVATIMNNMGIAYMNVGEHRKALDYLQEVLTIWEEVYGEKHPNVATAMNNLGSIWKGLKEPRKAIDYFQQALSILEKAYGEKHHQVATAMDTLGSAYIDIGEHSKALDYIQKALIINEAVFGRKHPDVARSLNNLGSVYNALNDHRKALEYYQEALDIMKDVYGEKHPHVAVLLNNLGALSDNLGKLPQAIDYYQQSLSINEAVLGREHPLLVSLLINLGAACFDSGKKEEAKSYFEKAYKIIIKFLGPEHPETKKVIKWLNKCASLS